MESREQASASDAVLLMPDRSSAPGPVKRDDWRSLPEHNGTPPVACEAGPYFIKRVRECHPRR